MPLKGTVWRVFPLILTTTKTPQTVTLQVTILCLQISKKTAAAPEHSFALLCEDFCDNLLAEKSDKIATRSVYRLQCFRDLPNHLGQKSCRTKVPRIFRIFVPDFLPNFPPNFPRNFRGFFVLRFVGNGDQKKIHQKSPPFFNAKFQANTKKIFTKCFWRAGNVTIIALIALGVFFHSTPGLAQ